MEYKLFYLAIRRYAKRKISRWAFIRDWKYAQFKQGIETGNGGNGICQKN